MFIEQTTLTNVIEIGDYAGFSLGFLLTQRPEGIALLNQLARANVRMTKTALNDIVQGRSVSVAFLLADTSLGCELLAHLVKFGFPISSRTLNTDFRYYPNKATSLALLLAKRTEGCKLLFANANALLKQINPQILNTIIGSGTYIGYSVASLLELRKNNERMLPLYASALANQERLTYGYERASVRKIPSDLLGLAMTMLDGRERTKLTVS